MADSDGAPISALVSDLLRALDEASILYCHWKSNEAIAKTLVAENDLDLLVARADASAFNAVVHDLGFRVARPSSARHVPGMVDYFGFDEVWGRMVHVQAHYQLVLGDDMTKNFRLPVEDAYLESREFDGPIAVANSDFELLLFVVRMVLKHCPWDAQVSMKGRLTASERRELDYLVERSDAPTLEALRARHIPAVSQELFAQCRSVIEADADHVDRAIVGRRLLSALEPFGRSPNRSDLRLRLWRRFRRRRQDGRPPSRRTLDSGGLLVGVVGGDGSGKSSVVAALGETFSRHFPTHTVHLGKPERSLSTRVAQKAIRSIPGLQPAVPTSSPAWTDWEAVGFPGTTFLVWHLLTARDRRRTYRWARQTADRGAVVISDRFPLADIHLMDSPRGVALPGLGARPLARWLAAQEARCYDEIIPPDLLIVLRVHPDIAVARRGEQSEEFVRRRAEEVWSHPPDLEGATVIDASQDHDTVVAEVHAALWQAL